MYADVNLIPTLFQILLVCPSSLPVHQDCHEMWSKKKKKKEGKVDTTVPPSGKPKLHNSTGHEPQSIQCSPPPSNVGEHYSSATTSGHLPVATHRLSTDRSIVAEPKPFHSLPHHLSVPLPLAPLPSASILESLSNSMSEGVALSNSSNGGSATDSLQLKKVIAKAQRNLINQITQKLEQGGPHEREQVALPLVPSISGRATQTFDYDNQSNTDLEAKAVARLYNKDLPAWI